MSDIRGEKEREQTARAKRWQVALLPSRPSRLTRAPAPATLAHERTRPAPRKYRSPARHP
ncbi:hypothetical protein AXK11_08425 [Cephaloticoccus primus]|uniref:Uncharacterized protein n=1 Tax=Cephaloticoccus primus TaxID=1548207 RepID=A0A139SIM6_9BACT|nr:hypothetical protein AXK11_08425 [Cephaloticoccus primus]